MTKNTPNGGPAFACDAETKVRQDGMTLRDYFAAAALQGTLANVHPHLWESNPARYASIAYKTADAMLVARGGGK
jgi:hypothetical protein